MNKEQTKLTQKLVATFFDQKRPEWGPKRRWFDLDLEEEINAWTTVDWNVATPEDFIALFDLDLWMEPDEYVWFLPRMLRGAVAYHNEVPYMDNLLWLKMDSIFGHDNSYFVQTHAHYFTSNELIALFAVALYCLDLCAEEFREQDWETYHRSFDNLVKHYAKDSPYPKRPLG